MMKKFRRYKIIVKLAIILLLSAGIAGVYVYKSCTATSENPSDSSAYDSPDSLYFADLELRCKEMTRGQKLRYKEQCEQSLRQIDSELASGSLNPEERHEAILRKNFIRREHEIVSRYLP